MNNITPVVKQLLIINIIFFIGSQLVPIADNYFALYYFENPMFKFWQPLTQCLCMEELCIFFLICLHYFLLEVL